MTSYFPDPTEKAVFVRRIDDGKFLRLVAILDDEIVVEEVFEFAQAPHLRPLKLHHKKSMYEMPPGF